MASEKLIVIIGITGQQGGSVSRVFQFEPGWRIRGITRDPSKPSNASLRDAGVDLVAGDLDDPASLDRAFAGADAIFSVTDFWQFVQPGSSTFAEAEKAGVEPNQIALEKEVRQGRNIIDAAARAHAQKPLHRFVVSTLSNTAKWSNGKLLKNLHFDGKAQYCEYLKTTYPGLAKQTSYIQIGFYLSNWNMFPFMSPRKSGSSGDFVYPTFTHEHGGKPVPFLDTPNDTGHFVRALVLSPKSPPETNMLGYSTLITTEEYIALWAKTLGVKAEAQRVTLEDVVKTGLPEWLGIEVSQSGEYSSVYGWDGGEPGVVSPEEGGVDLSRLTNLEEWIKKEDWSGIM